MARKKKSLDVKNLAINALAIAGGAAASGVVDSLVLSRITSLSPLVKGVIKMAAGAIIPPLVAPNSFVEKFGDGMIAMGGYQVLHAVLPTQIPAIAGIGAPQVQMGLPVVSGNGLPVVSGMPVVTDESEGEPDFFTE